MKTERSKRRLFIAGLGKASRLAAAAALAGLLACSSATTSYRNPDMDMGSIYTVGVMPLINMTRDQLASERVRDVFMTMMLTNGIYVVPPGEVARQVSLAGVANPAAPTTDEVIKLGKMLKADAIITGAIREYGEARSGSASGNLISLSLQITEAQTGRIVSSAATTRGGVGMLERLFGGGGEPMNDVTEKAVSDVIENLLN